MKSRVLMTTTAYPPSVGGVQSVVKELREGLTTYDADVVTLWLENRTDWLTGTTVRLGRDHSVEIAPGLTALGWDRRSRARMAPWIVPYYMNPRIVAPRIAAQLAPILEQTVGADHRLIHNHRIGREFLAQASLLVARRRRIPFVLSPYHHERWRGYRYEGWREVYLAADAVLTLTEAEIEELHALGVARDKLHYAGCGADPPLRADPNRFLARIGNPAEPIVLFVGQQYEYKGVADLVSALESMHARNGVKAQLAFIGPETPFSRRFFSAHPHAWLHNLGKVDGQTKWDAIEASAVVCLPSRQESFGRVYLEAWSKGKPVIGARIPSVSEVITDGETGFLVDPGSVEQLAQALERLLGSPELSARLAVRGKREVETRFSWSQVVARVEAVYASVLASNMIGRVN